jgi:1,4-dihydroxy-2-naphthoyl-CoA hydrolase
MPFSYSRTIRLADTDAAGVVYFARTLSLCHEAYEASLAAAGIDLNEFLGANGIVIPISRSEADYLRPLRPGENVRIDVAPEPLSENAFALRYTVVKLGPPEKVAARVRTEHVCTVPAKRERAPLPPAIAAWIAAG